MVPFTDTENLKKERERERKLDEGKMACKV